MESLINILDFQEKIMSDYKDYVTSFSNIKNDQIRKTVDKKIIMSLGNI